MTRAEYDREVEAGAFIEEDRVELLAGRVVDVSPEGPSHASTQGRLLRQLFGALDLDRWVIRPGHPLALSDVDEPEPDLVVAASRADDYFHSHPSPDEVALVVEITQSSQRRDLVLKAERYALAGIGDHWVVDLIDQVTVVHRRPERGAGQYGEVRRVPAGPSIGPLGLGPVVLTPLVAG